VIVESRQLQWEHGDLASKKIIEAVEYKKKSNHVLCDTSTRYDKHSRSVR
jgi:hypothetical protein